MDALLAELLNSPLLPRYRDWVRDYLAAEQQRREQFYATLTSGKHGEKYAEFVNGEVIAQQPVTIEHAQVVRRLLALLMAWVQQCGGFVGHEYTMVSLARNDYLPDICFFGREKTARFVPQQMRFPAPDLAVEVLSPNTEKIDRTIKFEDYAAHGVLEYWIIEPSLESLEQYVLQGESYELLSKSRTATIVSVAMSGFTFPARAIFDQAEYQASLQRLLAAVVSTKDTHVSS